MTQNLVRVNQNIYVF